jgi:hypothetical protein
LRVRKSQIHVKTRIRRTDKKEVQGDTHRSLLISQPQIT